MQPQNFNPWQRGKRLSWRSTRKMSAASLTRSHFAFAYSLHTHTHTHRRTHIQERCHNFFGHRGFFFCCSTTLFNRYLSGCWTFNNLSFFLSTRAASEFLLEHLAIRGCILHSPVHNGGRLSDTKWKKIHWWLLCNRYNSQGRKAYCIKKRGPET